MKEPFWIRFDLGNGLFIEKEFEDEDEFYDYLEGYPDAQWKRVDKGGT